MGSKNQGSGFDLPDDEPTPHGAAFKKDSGEVFMKVPSGAECNKHSKVTRGEADIFEMRLFVEPTVTFPDRFDGVLKIGCEELGIFGVFEFRILGFGSRKQTMQVYKSGTVFMDFDADEIFGIINTDRHRCHCNDLSSYTLMPAAAVILKSYRRFISDKSFSDRCFSIRLSVERINPLDFFLACFGSMPVRMRRSIGPYMIKDIHGNFIS